MSLDQYAERAIEPVFGAQPSAANTPEPGTMRAARYHGPGVELVLEDVDVQAPARKLVRVPEGLPLDEAATVGCSVATALHAMRAVARVQLGETVVVYGVGAVGFALVQLARLAGARVVAVGRTAEKLDLARELGAGAVVSSAGEDPVAAV